MSQTKSIYSQDLRARSNDAVFSFYYHNYKEGELDLNADYQRDYVWGYTEQQALLQSVFKRVPLQATSMIVRETFSTANKPYCEQVDGKQRVTTLIKFQDNEIPYVDPETSKEIYFKDLSRFDQSEFKKTRLPYLSLETSDGSEPTRLQILEYFHRTNFAGVPQSEEHREYIEVEIEKEQAKLAI
ncbi:DUF262 domain-containing protein [Vibrio alginolyticus]|uniref:DUF262 domain-containing protein n=1 Tax=Vibrio alginolyticus TaxID=663 RepID=UPI0006CA77AC|nr:DUF262 domain-containing protein [Vibrio alginolyticus]CAH7202065.1 conserved hypothetical protein [Vibrio chagasii]CAH7369289.1 conserved hypothetical protein [Vibrio chagasii]